jgi:hypothetical protein
LTEEYCPLVTSLFPEPGFSPRLRIFLYSKSEKTGKERYKGDTDEGHTATGHELLHALGLRTGVIVAVTLHEVDSTPNAKTCTKCNYECLKYAYCALKKCHN